MLCFSLMPKNILIIIAVIALLGAGWYFYAGKNASMPYPGGDNSSIGEKMSGSIADLINAGKSLQCSFSSSADGYSSDGTVFVSGSNVRGDFNSEQGGKETQSHMIQNGENIYTWTDEPKQGMVMKISKEDAQKYKDEAESSAGSFNMDDSYEYSCMPWGSDSSKFTPPSDVQFTDLSAQMEQMTESMKGNNQSACSACDSLDPEAKASCKQALNCE